MLQARNNSFGDYGFVEFARQCGGYFYPNGSGQYNCADNWPYEAHSCGRHNHTANPLITRHGIPNYRMPSDYRRYVWDAEPIMGAEFLIGGDGTKYVEDGIVANFSLNHAWPPQGGSNVNYDDFVVKNSLNRATTEALVQMKDMKANVALALAEARKSVDLIGSTSVRLLRALQAVKRTDYKRAARILGLDSTKGLARNYLEFNYGWKPLIMDIRGARELLKQQLAIGMPITGRRTVRTSDENDATFWGYQSGQITTKVQATSCITGVLDDTYKRIGSQTGFTDPLLLGWELIPYSFVVDWMFPVGNFLEALQASAGLQFVSGWNGVKLESEFEIFKQKPGWTVESPRGFKGKGFCYRRRTYQSFPKPLPYVKSPFSTKNVLNALALFRNHKAWS